MMRRWVVIPVLVLAACGGGSGSGSSATTAVEVSVPAPTTAAPTSTVAPTTTTIAPTTTTEAATTTTLSLRDEFQAIEEAFYVDYEACLADPGACDPTSFTTGDALERLKAAIADMIGFDLYSGPGLSAERVVVLSARQIDPEHVELAVCNWDPSVVYSRAPADQPPLVVNDAEVTHWFTKTWAQVGDEWLLQRQVEDRPEVAGTDECDG